MTVSPQTHPEPARSIDDLRPPARVSALAGLRAGAAHALRYWPVLLILLLGTLLPALLVAALPGAALLRLAERPVIETMARGIPAWLLVDLVGLFNTATPMPGAQAARQSMGFLITGLLLMPLLGGLVSALLYGGVLLTYREAPAPFSLRRFAWGCWHWFGAFLGLALLQFVLFFIIYVPLSALSAALGGLGAAGQAAALALILLLAALWVVIFELARARMVAGDFRNPFRAVGQAFVWLFRRLPDVLAFYALALLALLAAHALFRLLINPNLPLDALLPVLLIQQGFILLRLWLRALRLAGLMELVRA